MSLKDGQSTHEFEGERGEEGEANADYGEGREIYDVGLKNEFVPGEDEEKEWGPSEAYGEDTGYYLYRPAAEAAEYLSVWEDKESVGSELTVFPSEEEEETEEEKELRREREALIEELRQKIMERMLLRRRNSFLQKKLVEHFKKRRMENVLKEDPKGLDLESKYLKRLYAFQEFKVAQEKEIDDLTTHMAQYENDTKELNETLNERLRGFMQRAKEVSLNLILTKTGKRVSEKEVDRLLRRQMQKNVERGKKKLAYIKIKHEIEDKEMQLKAMEYIGEGLHIGEYEQMKIDNQNYTDKIEEKEDELTKMRVKTQIIMQNLSQIREKAYAIEGDIELMEEKVYDVEIKFAETRERLTKARIKRDSLREECARLKTTSGLLTKDRLLRDFEASIYEGKTISKNLGKIKKQYLEKKKQSNQLSKIVENQTPDLIIPLDLKVSRSQRFDF